MQAAKACIFLYVHIVCQNTKRRACAHTTHIDFVLFQYVKKGHNKHLDLFTKEDGWNILWHSGGLLLLKMEGKIMKRRITTVIMAILAFTLLMPFVSPAAYAADLLESKAVYYTEESDYMDGDCILTASRMMIRRAAIMRNNSDWSEITNESLRPEATTDGLLLYSFSYEAGGVTYSIASGSFKEEGSRARIGEFESLLRDHPEGIVVWGTDAASTGTHGVLVVKAENGEVYAMDSSYNMGPFKEGIQKWKDTTMLDPSLVTDYWYISEVNPDRGITGTYTDSNGNTRAHTFILNRLRLASI